MSTLGHPTGIMVGYPTGKIRRDPTGIKVGPTGKIGWDPTGKIRRDPIGIWWDPDEFSQWAPLGPTLCPTGIPVGSHWDSQSNFHWGLFGCGIGIYSTLGYKQIL